jgi:hypothetical protein
MRRVPLPNSDTQYSKLQQNQLNSNKTSKINPKKKKKKKKIQFKFQPKAKSNYTAQIPNTPESNKTKESKQVSSNSRP